MQAAQKTDMQMTGAAPESERRIAISTALFDGYPLETAIDEIADGGARWIEPAFIKNYVDFDETAFSDANASALSRRLSTAGLGVTAVSAHLDLGTSDAVDALRPRIRFAASLGARFVITNTGVPAHKAAILHAIRSVIPDCRASGVCLALESPGHGVSDLIPDGETGSALIEALSCEWVRLNYDVGNAISFNKGAIDPAVDLARAGPAVAHLHLKDLASAAGGWRFAAIGDGLIDYRNVWRRVARDLPVALELPFRLARPFDSGPVRAEEPVALDLLRHALRRSLDFVRQLDDPALPTERSLAEEPQNWIPQ